MLLPLFHVLPGRKGVDRGIAASMEACWKPFISWICPPPPIITTSTLRPQHMFPTPSSASPSGTIPALHLLPPWESAWKSGGGAVPHLIPRRSSSSRCLKVRWCLLLAACPSLSPCAAPAAQVSPNGTLSRTPHPQPLRHTSSSPGMQLDLGMLQKGRCPTAFEVCPTLLLPEPSVAKSGRESIPRLGERKMRRQKLMPPFRWLTKAIAYPHPLHATESE